MIRYAVLGSGSNANSYIFEADDFAVVVDNGFSCKAFLERVERAGFRKEHIRYILLTHPHADHLRGVERLSRQLRVPVITHWNLTEARYVKKGFYKRLEVRPNRRHRFGELQVLPFHTSHDAPCSLSYHFALGGRTFTVITDTGQLSRQMVRLAGEAEVLFLEANHSVRMLKEGFYPEELKRRILSPLGHLSNLDAARLLDALPRTRLREVYLCHLSANNNSPAVLEAELAGALRRPAPVHICPRGALCRGPEA